MQNFMENLTWGVLEFVSMFFMFMPLVIGGAAILLLFAAVVYWVSTIQ